jgi:hypothetical protein
MPESGRLGAYGFRLVVEGAEAGLPGLVPVPAGAEEVTLAWREGAIPEDRLDISGDRAHIAVKDLVSLRIERATRTVAIDLPEPPLPEAIVHPVATTPLAVLSRWQGRATLHAGAVFHEGAAYAVCGGQNSGKSTTLAALAARGLPIVTDDLLVVDDGQALAGPSCVDLRADTAERFPGARFLGTVGARERFRLSTSPAPPRVPLRGVFLLGWSTDPEPKVVPLSLEERARVIHVLDYAAMVGLARGEALLDLLALPMWALTRRRDWDASERALDLLLETAAAH